MAAPDGAAGTGESKVGPGARSRRRSVGPRGRRNSLSSNEGSGGMTPEAIAAMATAAAAGSTNSIKGARPTSPDNHARRPRDRRKSDSFITGGNSGNKSIGKRRSSTKKFKRRGSVTVDSTTGCFRQRFGISKKHVQIFNKQLDRDEPQRHFVKSLIATGTVNLGELSEVGGTDLLGYPDGNEKGETRSFMLALSM